ncbi:MAG TPA: hypothetical protein VD766_12700, partial [Solirubrobacterales bacterium]|nr:hypothetical protein [Solirubrobacterales bacterium]
MCPTPVGRIHTRVAILVPGAILGVLLSIITGRPDWIVLIGVFLLLGISLDAGLYSWAVHYQPPWMTFVLALFEFGLLLVLANILELNLSLAEAIIFYWVVWSMAAITKVVVLPIASLTYLESAGEFRRIEWSVPDTQASLPVLASVGAPSGAGLFDRAVNEGAHSLPLAPSPSGVHQLPVPDAPGERGPAAGLRLVEIEPQGGRALVVQDKITIGREGCDISLDD